MSYKVIRFFTDLQDFNHPYKVGDTFPRKGMNVSEARLKELSSKNNKQGQPLIELVKDVEKDDFSQYMNPPEESKRIQNQYNKTIINRMSTAELKELAKEQGIKNAEEMTGADLKVELIKHFGL